MGNTMITPCFGSEHSTASFIKVISHGGATRILTGNHLAGEIMFEFPRHMVCHADSFFIGNPIPSLSIGDKLVSGQTYFLLPLDSFPHKLLSASSLAALASGASVRDGGVRRPPVKFKESPFEYRKGSDGNSMIKVSPEFIARLITRGDHVDIVDGGEPVADGGGGGSFLCSTPELKRRYDQLVGCRDHNWSPNLDTISEHKIRFSPCRFIGL